MIKMSKKITVILSLFCISLLFFSCTFMEETKTAKVSFSAGKLLKSNARSAISFEGGDVIEISLLGDYTETQKITNLKENTKIIFAEVPLEAKVYAELIIYNKTPDNIKYFGKSDPIIVKEGDNILTVYVKAVKNENTENPENDDIEATYIVIHKVQNIDDDNYFEDETLRDKESGKAGSTTNAKAKDITGFTAQAFDQVEIKSDNSTEVIIYYDRELHTLTYEGGSDDVTNLPESKKYRFGAKATIEAGPTRTGYTFAGWKDSVSGITYTEGIASTLTMGTEDITLYAQWTVESYNITYYLDGGSWAAGYTASEAYTYGQRQSLPDAADVSKAGYGLTGWTTGDGTTITEISADMTGDIKLIALWTAGATNYTVHHWQQNIDDDEYTEVAADAQTLAGLSEESTNASANTYEGFTAKTFTQQTIQADGSTVIDIYYDRNVHNVTYTDGKDKITPAELIPSSDIEGAIPSQESLRYGATGYVQVSVKPSLKGYTFAGWKKDDTVYTESSPLSFTMGDEDIEIYAVWEPAPDTEYKVHHLKQNVDDDDYTLADTITETGSTGNMTNASDKTYTGFTVQGPVTQEIIDPDGDTIVEIKYNRNTYTVTYDANALSAETISVPSDTTLYRYEAPVTVKFTGIGSRTGYTFAGWARSSTATSADYTSSGTTSFNMTDSNVTLYAVWEVENQNTGIDAGFGLDTSTVEVSQSGATFTATSGYDSYSWTVDGTAQTSTTNVLDLSSITVAGVYDITLTATKTVSGSTVTHTWTGQYIKS